MKTALSKCACFVFVIFSLSSSAQRIAAGSYQSLAVCSDSTVMAWGANYSGQLGDGTFTSTISPVQTIGLTGVVAVSSGDEFSLALKNDGTVWAWGDDLTGQLGDSNNVDSPVPVKVHGLSGVTAIATGYYHSLAIRNDSTVWSWGYNLDGELGNGTNVESRVPVQVSSLSGIVAIAAGRYHSLALKSDGTVWAWGLNDYSQLGNGTTVNSNVPVSVFSLTNITAISAGPVHSLALKGDGSVWSWGINSGGELGIGSYSATSIPVLVAGVADVVAVASGNSSYTLKSDGTVSAWGNNMQGGLAIGWGPSGMNAPVPATIAIGIVSLETSIMHTLMVRNDGTIWAWGWNASGQVGDSTMLDRYFPVETHGTCPVSTESYCIAHYTTDYDSLLNAFTLTVDSASAAMGLAYHWDFGDGTTSSLLAPSHIYTADTTYKVCMQLYTAAGDSCKYCHSIGKDYLGNIIRGGFTLNVANPGLSSSIQTDRDINNTFFIYPNPSGGKISIIRNDENIETGKIRVLNLLGEEIYSADALRSEQIELDLSGQRSGIYFVELRTGSETNTRKIIINK